MRHFALIKQVAPVLQGSLSKLAKIVCKTQYNVCSDILDLAYIFFLAFTSANIFNPHPAAWIVNVHYSLLPQALWQISLWTTLAFVQFLVTELHLLWMIFSSQIYYVPL